MVVTDLITNGSRSLRVARTLADAGCEVIGIVAMLDFGFSDAADRFEEMGISMKALSNYNHLLDEALTQGVIVPADIVAFSEWHDDPESWTPGGNDNE